MPIFTNSFILFLLVLILSPLDYKYNWFQLPLFISIIASIVFLITYVGFIELLRENEYLLRVVEVQKGQQVISSGMYSIVRHPMYSILFFMFISFPLILGL